MLMCCFAPVFLGTTHPVTFAAAVVCLVASALMLKNRLMGQKHQTEK